MRLPNDRKLAENVDEIDLILGGHDHDYNVEMVISTNIYNMFRVRVMVFNATFNNISVILWRSVLLVEETGVPRENHRFIIT
jgi:2',3'-cyclic-nucleotide 2'-phosphodiesterase (5'-nucleotidase family)